MGVRQEEGVQFLPLASCLTWQAASALLRELGTLYYSLVVIAISPETGEMIWRQEWRQDKNGESKGTGRVANKGDREVA